MTGQQTQAMQNSLEEFLDAGGSVSFIISALSEIALLKAEHVRSNWQDETLARTWERMGRVLDRSYNHINKVDRMLP